MNETGACCGYGADRATLRRQRITEAARKLFITNGFHATGVAQIAKESGVAVGQIYRDFEAKEDIVAQIVEGDAKKFVLRETLQRAISENDSAAVWAWIRQFVEPSKCLDTNQLFAEIVAESARNERIAAIFSQKRESIRESMFAALELLAPGDHLSEQRSMLADLIVTMSLGLKQHRLLQPQADTDRLVANIMTVVEHEIELLLASTPSEAR